MFRQAGLTICESAMAWGLEIPESWYPLIDQLAADIDEIAPDCVEFAQIKQKFGMLRVYYDLVGEVSKEQEEKIDKRIELAEYEVRFI